MNTTSSATATRRPRLGEPGDDGGSDDQLGHGTATATATSRRVAAGHPPRAGGDLGYRGDDEDKSENDAATIGNRDAASKSLRPR